MATRRIASNEKTILEKDDAPEAQSNITPAVPTDVIVKLLIATFAMIAVPIGSYFLTVNTIFQGNSTYAGGLAALMANVVLIGYIIVAYNEDLTSDEQQKRKGSKAE